MNVILRTDQQKIHTTPLSALEDEIAAPAGTAQPDVDRPIVLIVDDEPDVIIILDQLLRRYAGAFDVLSASNPTEALQIIASGRVCFLITDFNMVELNGLQLAVAAKKHSPTVPVLLITAYSTNVLEQLARQYRVDYYLAKPFRLSALEQMIATVLGAHTG